MGGVIDSGFRGEVKVILKNLSNEYFKVDKNMRIAQMLFQKIEQFPIEIVEELDETDRGFGFGSSGLD